MDWSLVDTVRTTRAPAVLKTRTRPGLRTGVWEGMRGGAPVTPADLAQVELSRNSSSRLSFWRILHSTQNIFLRISSLHPEYPYSLWRKPGTRSLWTIRGRNSPRCCTPWLRPVLRAKYSSQSFSIFLIGSDIRWVRGDSSARVGQWGAAVWGGGLLSFKADGGGRALWSSSRIWLI